MMSRKTVVAFISTAGIVALALLFIYFLGVTFADPNAVPHAGAGLTMAERINAEASIGVGYVAVVDKTGDLWLYRSGESDCVKLTENVVSAVPLVWQDERFSCLGILY